MGAKQYPQTIFILGTSRNVGKTVTCVGIIASLLSDRHGYTPDEIGYIKPVGQQTVTVMNGAGVPVEADKDAVLITSLFGIECHGYETISPVVWAAGVTAQFIDDAAQGDPLEGRQRFLDKIRDAYEHVAYGKRVVIVEGTGQPGVGSVAGISNADVINELRAMGVPLFVVMVTEGGIGSTIDEIFPYLMAMDHLGAHVDGLIINGVYMKKLDKIHHYLQTYYEDIFPALYGNQVLKQPMPPILGYVPIIPELKLPSMRLIAESFATAHDSLFEVIAPRDFDTTACVLVRKVKVISLDFGYEPLLEPGDAVIVGVNANDAVLAMLLLHERLERKEGLGLSGLILSCKQVGGLAQPIRELILAGDLPTIMVGYDSADIVKRIEGLTIKIQPYDAMKKTLIADAFNEYLTLWPEAIQSC